jgi:hypothetical protein
MFRVAVVLDALAVIHEVAYGQLGRQLGNAAHVVIVIVRHHQVVDLLYPGLLGHRGNAVGIPHIHARPAGIHQQRLLRRSDDQGRLPALHVHKIDFEGLGGWQRLRSAEQKEG